MRLTRKHRPIAILVFVLVSAITAFAQGGWRQWEIHLRDGGVVEANPLGMNEKGLFTRSMSEKESGIERAKIAYLAAARSELPTLPSGNFKQDVVVMLDGSKVIGAMKFREIRFSEGTFVQHGRVTTLENVAYIIFKRSRKR